MRFGLLFPVLLLLLTLFVPANLHAQDTPEPEPVRVVMVDGSTHIGVIIAETETTLTLRTASGIELTLAKDQIRSTLAVGDRMGLRPDPNRSRLFFSPTARPLDKGTGYVASYELFFPFVGVGVTRRTILAGGFSLLPGAPGQLVYVAPKVTVYQTSQVAAAVGVLGSTFVGNVDDVDFPIVGLLYGVGTFGKPQGNITVGLAFGFADGEFGQNPAVLVGGERQLSDRVKLLTENYVIAGVEDAIILSGGVRFIGERLSADLALFTVPAAFGEGGFPFFPWLGFAYSFGSPK